MRVNHGKTVSIRGSVVDVLFPSELPEPRSLLKAGENQQIALEVITYLSSQLVRTIALTPTPKLRSGVRRWNVCSSSMPTI